MGVGVAWPDWWPWLKPHGTSTRASVSWRASAEPKVGCLLTKGTEVSNDVPPEYGAVLFLRLLNLSSTFHFKFLFQWWDYLFIRFALRQMCTFWSPLSFSFPYPAFTHQRCASGLYFYASQATGLEQNFTVSRVWGWFYCTAVYPAASCEAVNGSRPVSVRPPGCYYVSCHCRGMQVSSATHTIHALLHLDLDDRILSYIIIKVCVGRLTEPL